MFKGFGGLGGSLAPEPERAPNTTRTIQKSSPIPLKSHQKPLEIHPKDTRKPKKLIFVSAPVQLVEVAQPRVSFVRMLKDLKAKRERVPVPDINPLFDRKVCGAHPG